MLGIRINEIENGWTLEVIIFGRSASPQRYFKTIKELFNYLEEILKKEEKK